MLSRSFLRMAGNGLGSIYWLQNGHMGLLPVGQYRWLQLQSARSTGSGANAQGVVMIFHKALLFLVPLSISLTVTAADFTTPEQAEAAIEAQGYPLPRAAVNRFAGFESLDELAQPGKFAGMNRALRFLHVTDLQLVDDDAPFPMRQGLLDEVYAATISSGGERPQEEFADEIMQSLIEVANAHHRLDALDFVMHTGDNFDNALENEAMRYLDLLNGTSTTTGPISGLACQPDGQSASTEDFANDQVNACTSLPVALAGKLLGFDPSIPQYVSTGNHDLLIQGNVAVLPSFKEMALAFGRHFLHIDEFVNLHFANQDRCAGGSDADHNGHGFGRVDEARRCDDDVENDSYYAFEGGGIRHIVLDTVNDDYFQTNENLGFMPNEGATGHDTVTGLSEGALDIAQWEWLQDEIEAADSAGQLVILYSHHTVNSFYNEYFDPLCGPPGCLSDVLAAMGFVGRDQVRARLDTYPNLLAWVGGHTHQHRVTAVPSETTDGFWNIESAGLLDMPQESRIVEIWADPSARKGFLALDPIGHLYEAGRELAASDEQHDAVAAAGEARDRRALLWFDIPPGYAVPGQGRNQ